MSNTKNRPAAMLVLGFLLAIFMQYGNVGMLANYVFETAGGAYTVGYIIKLLMGLAMLTIACRKKVPAIILSAVFVLVNMAVLTKMSDTIMRYNSGSVFMVLLSQLMAVFMLICALSPKAARGIGVVALVLAILTFNVSLLMSMMDYNGNFIGMNVWVTGVTKMGFSGLFKIFLENTYVSRSMATLFPFSVSLNFFLLYAAAHNAASGICKKKKCEVE